MSGSAAQGRAGSYRAVAQAGINVALVKYWGKRDERLNLPETGSLSLTLAELGTRTAVRFDPALDRDVVALDGKPADEAVRARTSRFLDLVRGLVRERACDLAHGRGNAFSGAPIHAEVTSESTVPVGAGLASSASAFAALAAAAAAAAGLRMTMEELSALARRGSGSAARSVFGGFVEMLPGAREDGEDAIATPLPTADGWAVQLVVAETADGAKDVGSTEGMRRTVATSPFHPAFVAAQAADLAAARDAIARRDLRALGEVAEANALRMHADALAASPPLLYWNGVTIEALRRVRLLRTEGVAAYATIDAGPHVKALCAAADAGRVAAALAAVPGVRRTRALRPGPGVRVLERPVGDLGS